MTRSAFKTVAFLAAGLAAGFAIASWSGRSTTRDDARVAAVDGDGLAGRVATLERLLERESQRRAVLETELEDLRDRLSDVASASAGDGLDGIAAGFTPDRAAWITQRTAELRMQALEEEYRAARAGEEPATRGGRFADETLRAELGDQDYELYLSAIGRPTRIAVRSVLASSPAEQAGLAPGDQVVGYDGRRVFDTFDLNRLTLEGRAGEIVALDVVRDGQQIQLYVPRGPIGIVGGGRFGRRP